MKLYHGTRTKDLKIETHIRSRYGFSAFFATPNKELAIQYAYHNFLKFNKGYLYAFNFNEDPFVVDFKNSVSHSMVFRNLVFNLQKEHHESVLIKNVIDYPSERIATYKPSEIVIIFNLELIQDIKMVGKY